MPKSTYPGIVAAQGEIVSGKVVTGLTEQDFARLDAFEGPEYRRVPIEIEVSHGRMPCQIYKPVAALPPGAPTWSFSHRRREHKAQVLLDIAADAAARNAPRGRRLSHRERREDRSVALAA